MEIRELRAKDVKTLAKMLGKLKSSSTGDLFTVLDKAAKKKGDSNPMEVGLSLFRIAAADLTDDIYSRLADLIGKTVEELDEMSVNAPADIIKELVTRGEFKSFFGSVLQQAGIQKESLGSTT